MSGGLRVAVRHRANSRRRQRGAVAVEFALVLPLLVMLLVGTITTGLSYSRALGITNAVREGARYGAIADATAASWASDVTTRVHATQFDDPALETTICAELWKSTSPGVYPGAPQTSYCTPTGPGLTSTDFSRYPLPAVPGGVCVVRVVASRNFTISAPPFMPGVTQKMVRGSVARYEGKSC